MGCILIEKGALIIHSFIHLFLCLMYSDVFKLMRFNLYIHPLHTTRSRQNFITTPVSTFSKNCTKEPYKPVATCLIFTSPVDFTCSDICKLIFSQYSQGIFISIKSKHCSGLCGGSGRGYDISLSSSTSQSGWSDSSRRAKSWSFSLSSSD